MVGGPPPGSRSNPSRATPPAGWRNRRRCRRVASPPDGSYRDPFITPQTSAPPGVVMASVPVIGRVRSPGGSDAAVERAGVGTVGPRADTIARAFGEPDDLLARPALERQRGQRAPGRVRRREHRPSRPQHSRDHEIGRRSSTAKPVPVTVIVGSGSKAAHTSTFPGTAVTADAAIDTPTGSFAGGSNAPGVV